MTYTYLCNRVITFDGGMVGEFASIVTKLGFIPNQAFIDDKDNLTPEYCEQNIPSCNIQGKKTKSRRKKCSSQRGKNKSSTCKK